MANIQIKPPVLRSTAQALRQKSKIISSALTNLDSSLKSLSSMTFAGNRAVAIRGRYTKESVQLFFASRIITLFAGELEVAASIFEAADKIKSSVTVQPKPVPAPEQVVKKSGIIYDGKNYADGTYNPKDSYSARPVNPPLTNSVGNRSTDNYSSVINEFGVESNPRYDQRNGNTYCNIYVWDVTKAMGAEIPHWVDPKTGLAVPVGQGSELNANGVVNWLNKYGNQNGWHEVTPEQAQAMASEGKPSVAVWANFGGIGHVAMVRPGAYSASSGPLISQAGGVNTNTGTVAKNFATAYKTDQMQYFVHD